MLHAHSSEPRTESRTEPRAGHAIAAALVHPLDRFYAELRQPLPPVQQVHGEEVPSPQKELLVHLHDMTPTLEEFFGAGLVLRMLGRRRRGSEYFREVVLVLEDSGLAVEFGAIKIHLERFPAPARTAILEERHPLGHLLSEHRIPHLSRPKAFLRVASDRVINEALGLKGAHILYGRRNTLLTPTGEPLAEIVEILPPLERPPARGSGRVVSGSTTIAPKRP